MKITALKHENGGIAKFEVADPSPDLIIYDGKVRNTFTFTDSDKIAIIVSDRISAFDRILPKTIPHKGQVLNQLAASELAAIRDADICPVWFEKTIGGNISVGKKCTPIALEIIVRGYLEGSAWRAYRDGERSICGVTLPDGLEQAGKLPVPIITPTTKAESGHDENISKQEILDQEILTVDQYEQIENYALQLFSLGSERARQKGLILVDTKYEFGWHEGDITLMDEVHTPDSSRYYIAKGYWDRQEEGVPQIQLSKEFVRAWLMEKGFQGEKGQEMPDMPDDFVEEVSQNYISLYERLSAPFVPNQLMSAQLQKALHYVCTKNEVEI